MRELEVWSEPFLEALDHPVRRHRAPYHLCGLLGPSERKSVQPMFVRLGLPAHDQFHNLVAGPASTTSKAGAGTGWTTTR